MIRKYLLYSLCIFLICSCRVKRDRPFIIGTIFPGSKHINVPYYQYTDLITDITYYITSAIIYNETDEEWDLFEPFYDHPFDTVSDKPVFIWSKTNSEYVMVAVFSERISIDYNKNQISNSEDIVWAWNTGMQEGIEGNIAYDQGRNVVNGEIQYNKPPEPLEKGWCYVWAVWAWNDDATEISHSSSEMPFCVE